MIKISGNKIKINKHDIEELENIIKRKIPEEYCNFLLEYNGGIPESNIYKNDNVDIAVQSFYGIGLNNIDDLRSKMKVLKHRIPKECLPIAEIECGDVLCISLSKNNYGEILLWEHEKELIQANNMKNLLKVAPNFNEFMDKLKVYIDDGSNDPEVINAWIDPEFAKEMKRQNNLLE